MLLIFIVFTENNRSKLVNSKIIDVMFIGKNLTKIRRLYFIRLVVFTSVN